MRPGCALMTIWLATGWLTGCGDGDKSRCGLCDDGIFCTHDSCNEETGECLFEADDTLCPADRACHAGSGCVVEKDCQTDADCDDANVCTEDACVLGVGCANEAIGGACDDGNPCTAGDSCQQGVCVSGSNSCNCSQDTDCAEYDDGNLCNGVLKCDEGHCLSDPESPVVCDASQDTGCRTNTCDPTSGACSLVNHADGAACDDGNACTHDEMCSAGRCQGAAVDCDDGNGCTDDSCDPAQGCLHAANTSTCDDGSLCTTGDACANGTCTGMAVDCDDGNVCTDDGCNPTSGCTHASNTAACDDGNACTQDDACADGVCVPGTNTCQCEELSDCAAHEDDNLCNGTLICQDHACVVDPESVVVCDASADSVCRKNLCTPGTGECAMTDLPPSAACNDGDDCTAGDHCGEGICHAGQESCCADGIDNDSDQATDCVDTDGCAEAFACLDWDVAWCRLQYPEVVEITEGSQLAIYGWVFVEGLTEPAGPNAAPRLLGQAGFGPDGSQPDDEQAGWTWVGAAPNVSPAVDVGNNDEYFASFAVPAAWASPYDFAFRFSGDAGQHWVVCDIDAGDGHDGSQDGYAPEDAGHLTSLAGGACENPEDCAVFDDPDQCNGHLTCADFTCSVDPDSVVVCDADDDTACEVNTCDPDSGDCTPQLLDDGSQCDDLDDCTAGQATCLTGVCQGGSETCCLDEQDNDDDGATDCDDPDCEQELACQEFEVSWCRLQHPTLAEEIEGSTMTVYGWVLVPGLTEPAGPNPAPQVLAQAGVGPDGSLPAQGSWTWVDASPNPSPSVPVGDNDEYMGQLTVPPAAGSPYDFAYRFSADNGQTWTYCDTDAGDGHDGSQDGYQPANAGQLTSLVDTACDSDDDCLKFDDGDKCNGIFTCNPDTDTCAYDATTVVSCPEDTACQQSTCNPDTGICDPEAINPGGNCDDGDPCTAGTTCDAGECQGGTETCCDDDLDNDSDGDTSCADTDCAQAANCAVTVGWCRLQHPDSISGATGSVWTVYGQVFADGITNLTSGPDAYPPLVGELGYGTQSDLSDFVWQAAVPNPGFSQAANDEYMSDLTLPQPGTYHYAYRFSGDGGQTWTNCDLDGTAIGGFTFDKTGDLTVSARR